MNQIRTPGAVWFNDRDFDDIGVAIVRVDGALGVNTAAPDLAAMGGSVGQSVMSLDYNIEPRQVTVRVLLQATSAAEYAARLEKLVYLCSTGTVELRTAHDPDYILLVRWKGHTLPRIAPQFAAVNPIVGEGDLIFTCIVPFHVERTGKAYGITTAGPTGRVRIPNGSGPSLWEAELVAGSAPADNPTLTLYNDLGFKVGEMQWQTSLTAVGDFIRADATRQRTTVTVAGVESTNNGLLRTGDRWFLIRPQYGDWESQSWVYAEVTAGGTPSTGVIDCYLKVRRLKVT